MVLFYAKKEPGFPVDTPGFQEAVGESVLWKLMGNAWLQGIRKSVNRETKNVNRNE